MKYSLLLFVIIGLLNVVIFSPYAFAKEQDSSPLMMFDIKKPSTDGRYKNEERLSRDDNSPSSLLQRGTLSSEEPREKIPEEDNNLLTSQKTLLSVKESMNNIGASDPNAPAVDPNLESATSTSKATTNPQGSFEGVTIQQNPLSSFDNNDDMGRTWRHVPSSLPTDWRDEPAMRTFVKTYNRYDQIKQRQEAYQKELEQEKIKNVSTERDDHIFVLEKLIPVLEKASAYQNRMINYLTESESNDPRKKRSQFPLNLQASMQINESPNKIERIAEQIEQDHLELIDQQMILEILEQHASTPPPNNIGIPQNLRDNLVINIKNVKTHQQNLIEHKAAYAQALSLPFERVDPPTQAKIKKIELACRREENLRDIKILRPLIYIQENDILAGKLSNQRQLQAEQQAEKETQRLKPRQEIIEWYLQAANCYKQAVAKHAAFERSEAELLDSLALAFFKAAQEAQRLQPRQQSIDFYNQAADLYKQALTAHKNDYFSSMIIERSAISLYKAAQEAQRLQPGQQAIDFYRQEADLYKQAFASCNQAFEDIKGSGDNNNFIFSLRDCLFDSAISLDQAAQEAQKVQPRQQAIDLYRQAADRHKEAAAFIPANMEKASAIDASAYFLDQAARAAQEPSVNQEQIEGWLKSAAEHYQEAINPSSCIIN